MKTFSYFWVHDMEFFRYFSDDSYRQSYRPVAAWHLFFGHSVYLKPRQKLTEGLNSETSLEYLPPDKKKIVILKSKRVYVLHFFNTKHSIGLYLLSNKSTWSNHCPYPFHSAGADWQTPFCFYHKCIHMLFGSAFVRF